MAGRRVIRGRWAQWLRRAIQLGVVAFIAWGAMNVYWRNYKVAHNLPRLVDLMVGPPWGTLYAANETVLSTLGEPYQVSLEWIGLPWTATLGGLVTADPILVAANALKTGSITPSLLMALLIPLGIGLLLGKFFCSHLCPMRLLFEIGQWIRGGLLYLGVPLLQIRSPIQFGGWVLLGGLLATLTASTVVWLILLPYVGFAVGLFLLITGGAAAGLLAIVGGFLAVDIFLAPGQFCLAACPQGWLLGQLGRVRSWRLKKIAEPPCPTGCVACIRACPYKLSPKMETHLPSCDNCGRCVPACPDGKLIRRLVKPNLIAGLMLFCVLAPNVAKAHHNKGLPHYGYFQNYPQVPTEENVTIDGNWEFGGTLFNFQGLDRQTSDTPNDIKLYLYLYNLTAEEEYSGPVHFEIRLDDQVISEFDRKKPDEEAVYVSRETVPQSGDYVIVARFEGKNGLIRIGLPFYIELAGETNWALIIGLTIPLFLLFGLALLGRTKRGRARLEKARATHGGVGILAVFFLPRLARAQSNPDCADPESIVNAVIDAQGRTVMVMDGMPPGLLIGGMIGLIVLTFVGIEVFGTRKAPTWRRNLIKKRSIYNFFRTRYFPAIPQLGMVALLIFFVYAGLVGSQARNITPIAVWTIWWAGLIFAVAMVGPLFCTVCPWDGLANLATRLRLLLRVEPISLGLTVPKRFRNVYPAIILFIVLSWAELGLDTTTDPRQTAYLGFGMAVMAIAGALLFRGKAFCEIACPVGRISGIYSTFSPIEVRARNPKTCLSCTTEECLNGNERGYPCPTGLSLKTLVDSSMCTTCLECVKSCDRYNVALNLRPFGADLHRIEKPRLDLAILAVTLLALTLFHGLSMTTVWENPLPGADSFLKWAKVRFGTSNTLNFSVGMLLVVLFPIVLYSLASWVTAMWLKLGKGGTRMVFSQYAFALLPVALFYHLAHNSMHLLMEGGHIVPLLSDPLGTGADYFGTAQMQVGHLLSGQTVWILQLTLILIGHIFGVVVAHRISRRLFPDRGQAFKSLIPITLVMVAVSMVGLTLMALDMSMKLGRA